MSQLRLIAHNIKSNGTLSTIISPCRNLDEMRITLDLICPDFQTPRWSAGDAALVGLAPAQKAEGRTIRFLRLNRMNLSCHCTRRPTTSSRDNTRVMYISNVRTTILNCLTLFFLSAPGKPPGTFSSLRFPVTVTVLVTVASSRIRQLASRLGVV
jgi:hypothetical protein